MTTQASFSFAFKQFWITHVILMVLAVTGGFWLGSLRPHDAKSPDTASNGVQSQPPVAARKESPSLAAIASQTEPGVVGDAAWFSWLGTLTPGNWREAWAAYQALEPSVQRALEARALTKALLRRLGEVGGKDAFLMLASLPVDAVALASATLALEGWATQDPLAAAQVWRENPGHPLFEKDNRYPLLLAAVLKGAGLRSAEDVLALARQTNYSEADTGGGEFVKAVQLRGEAAEVKSLFETLLPHWATQEPNRWAGPPAFLLETVNVLINDAAEAPAEQQSTAFRPTGDWLLGLVKPGRAPQEDTFGKFVSSYSKSDAAAALSWVGSLAESVGKQNDYNSEQQSRVARQNGLDPAKRWAKQDAAGLGQWLSDNPHSPVFQTGAAALAAELKSTDPATAQAWAARVTDGYLRQWTKLDH